ncbi:MAG: hypothetical protein CMF70_03115 [Magnetovibrio sp.]|nr:hypothetical protein [Magnetovibrio sp.]
MADTATRGSGRSTTTGHDTSRVAEIGQTLAPRFRDISEPRVVCLYTGNGSGTKLFQGFLDCHPQILMIPGYSLMYLYPHWAQWRKQFGDRLDWSKAVNLLCTQHASILDSRELPGHDGLTRLGEGKDQALQIDSARFRETLLGLLDGEDVLMRTFLLAIHYAYGICCSEDLAAKKALVFHIHVPEYVPHYLAPDFPDMLILGFVRDPRSNIQGRYERSSVAVDAEKLNATDARIYLRRTYYFLCQYLLEGLEVLRGLPAQNIRVIRHEDLFYRQEETIDKTIAFLGIDFDKAQRSCTFGGLSWWGDPIYKMEPTNTANPRIVSLDWKKWLPAMDWFVLEGLLFDYCQRYGYELCRYKADTVWNRVLLFLAILLPSALECRVFVDYLRPSIIVAFLHDAIREGFDSSTLKNYTANAYYRHKWSNKGLRLWQPRWYVRMVLAAQKSNKTIIVRIASSIYVAANAMRYVTAVPLHLSWIVRRWGLSFRAMRRKSDAASILPKTIPEHLPAKASHS